MNDPDLSFFSRKLLTCYKPGRSKTLSGGVIMGFTFSLKNGNGCRWSEGGQKVVEGGRKVVEGGRKVVLVPRSWMSP